MGVFVKLVFMSVCVVLSFLASTAYAQKAITIKAPAKSAAVEPSAPVAPPVVTPLVVDESAPVPVTVKDESAAPPVWMQDAVVSVKKLPYIGPFVVKAAQAIAVLFSVLTALCAFLLVLLKALAGFSSLANLAKFADKVETFQNSKIMFYLKYLSAFNAQKPVKSEVPSEIPKAV